jgi:hypothetical protein
LTSPSGSVDADATARAHGWVAHLRDGGTTPWLAWSATGAATSAPVPGAQQLELLRRLNADARGPVPRDLADRVLVAPAAGRGQADLPLVGLAHRGFGAAPVDPSTISAHELLRVASVLLADDLVALGADPVATSWPRPWRRRVRLVGDPLVTAATRRHLLGLGRPEGGPRPFVVAIGRPLDELLAHTWTQRCFETGATPWGEWLRFWRERDQLPDRADLLESVRRWGGRRPFVRVVTDLDLLPRQVGVRSLPPVRVPGADQAELARRVAAVVGLRVERHERPALMRTLQQRIPDSGATPVGVPTGEREWVARSAARTIRGVTRRGYSVVGDLTDLAPGDAAPLVPAGPDDRQVLDLAIRMVVDPSWRRERQRHVEVER